RDVVGEAAVIGLAVIGGVDRPGRGELARTVDRLAEVEQAPAEGGVRGVGRSVAEVGGGGEHRLGDLRR
ncbi:hypothetical protein EU73_15195, partial [Staphylococcus aureus]